MASNHRHCWVDCVTTQISIRSHRDYCLYMNTCKKMVVLFNLLKLYHRFLLWVLQKLSLHSKFLSPDIQLRSLQTMCGKLNMSAWSAKTIGTHWNIICHMPYNVHLHFVIILLKANLPDNNLVLLCFCLNAQSVVHFPSPQNRCFQQSSNLLRTAPNLLGTVQEPNTELAGLPSSANNFYFCFIFWVLLDSLCLMIYSLMYKALWWNHQVERGNYLREH